MTKEEYLKREKHPYGVACDRKYPEYHLCELGDTGWYCPRCHETYEYELFIDLPSQ